MNIDLSIIIVNYNVKEFLINLINSIENASKNINVEIIIVDNNSSDGSSEFIKNNFPTVKLIENKKNLGFAKANNQGIKIAKGRYLLLLNPDTVVQENTFSTLIEFMDKNPEVGMCGCKVLNPDGTFQLACRRSFPDVWVAFTKIFGLSSLFPKSKLFGKYNLTYLDENQSYEVDAISGSFMFFKREILNKVPGLDEDYFMYGEDLDFCYRIKQSGYKIYYIHTTSIIHYKGESTKRSSIDEIKHFYQAMSIFVKKHFKYNIVFMFFLQMTIKFRSVIAFLIKYKVTLLQLFLDFITIVFSIYFAEQLYLVNKLGWLGFLPEVKPYVYIVPAIIFNLLSLILGSYSHNKIYISKKYLSLIFTFLFISAFTFFFKQYGYSRVVTALSFTFSGIIIFVLSFIFKVLFYSYSPNFVKVAVFGTEENSLKLSDKLKNSINIVYEHKGLISLSPDLLNKNIDGYKVIGTIDNLEKCILDYSLEKIIIPPNLLSFEGIMKLLIRCQNKVELLLATNELDYLVGKNNSYLDESLKFLSIEYEIYRTKNKILKRFLDLSILIVFAILLPLRYISKNRFIKNVYKNYFQVIKNELSIVGIDENSENLGLCKVGITGLWYIKQVENREEIEKLNIMYAKNYSLLWDFKIIIESFKI
jgi:hypothetical protein